MKKCMLILLCSIFSLHAAQAQNHAIGIRLGGSGEVLYQQWLSESNYLQFTLATPNWNGFTVTGTYNWRCHEWDWTPNVCSWHLDAGVGGLAGVYDMKNTGFLLGVIGSCAFGCQFNKVPISVDLDYRPAIGMVAGGGSSGLFTPGFWNFGISAAYHF